MNLLVTVMFVATAVLACHGLIELHQRQIESGEFYTLQFTLRTMESEPCNSSKAVSVDLSYRNINNEWRSLRRGIMPSEVVVVEEFPVTAGSVQFRWLQNNHRGGCFDCWEIDNVTITVPSEFSNPQPITFIDYSEGCDNDTLMNSISLCGGSASVPRGTLAIYNSTQESSELPCDIFQPPEASEIQRCQSCPPESSEKAFVQVKFQLFIGNGDVNDVFDDIDNFEEGVELAVKRVEDNQWIPLKFFTNTSKEQLQRINVGHYNNVSDTLSLRGYDVSVSNVPNEISEVHECICYPPSSVNQVQFRWLQTTEHRANSSGISVPRDTWYIDNVEILTTNGSCNQTLFNNSFSSQDLSQTLWPEIRGGEIKLVGENEMVFFFGDSDNLTTDNPRVLITTSRLAVTEIVTLNCPQSSDDSDPDPDFNDLLMRAEQIGTEAQAFAVVDDLIRVTETGLSQNSSQFADNFNATVSVLNAVTDFLNEQTTLIDTNETESLFDVINNVLNETNVAGFEELRTTTSTQTLLDIAETIGNYSARAVANDSTTSQLNVFRTNINVQARTVYVVTAGNEMVSFQTLADDMSDTAQLVIPAGRLQAIATINGNMSRIPVVHMMFANMENILPDTFGNGTTIPRSPVISSQVLVENTLDQSSASSPVNLINLTFNVQLNQSDRNPRCAFWNFSDPVGNGGWSFEGVTTHTVQTVEENMTVVQCSSTHLTSFAVLVDVGGARIDALALNIVSYIGCGISLACLLLSIIFFLGWAKRTVVTFVHLNLAIALFLGYLTFAVGTEMAASNEIACKFVAALLHYLFLSSFCWMLCEGIMIYLMLVVVFSRLARKWWFFLLLGWSLPLPFVAIGLATVLDEYGVRDDDGSLQFCWLSSGNGTNAIWTFVAPMLAIVVVNAMFLVLVLISLYKNKGGHGAGKQQNGKNTELAASLVKASLIILPLLGLTWVFGLFAVNNNTVVFAYLFTIFNSLQGLFIFIFHVVHTDKIWGRFKKSRSKTQYTVSSSNGASKSNVANGRLDSPPVATCEYMETPQLPRKEQWVVQFSETTAVDLGGADTEQDVKLTVEEDQKQCSTDI